MKAKEDRRVNALGLWDWIEREKRDGFVAVGSAAGLEEQGGESWAANVAGDRNEGKLVAGGTESWSAMGEWEKEERNGESKRENGDMGLQLCGYGAANEKVKMGKKIVGGGQKAVERRP